MKRNSLALLALLILVPQLWAVWAAHWVISPPTLQTNTPSEMSGFFAQDSVKLSRGVSVKDAGESQLRIVIEHPGADRETEKAYYLVVCKERCPTNAINFRRALNSWRKVKQRNPETAHIAEIKPLPSVSKPGTNIVEFVVEEEKAMRSYVVWDFRSFYESDGWVFINDGGLWLTYDLPAFVEKRDKPSPIRAKQSI